MSEKEIVEEFKNLTGASDSTAKSYLNSTKYDLNSAVQKFFDHETEKQTKPKKTKKDQGNINTFQSYGDSDDEKDETKRDYVGSGLNVIGSKKEDDIYSQILKKAQQQQQQALPDEKPQEKPKPSSEDKWKGGKKLGNTNVEVKEEKKEEFTEIKEEEPEEMTEEQQMMEIIRQINQQRGQQNQPKIEKEKSAVLTLYKNGFCINDGPFMSFDIPENKKMMEEINNGTVPKGIRDMIGPAMSYAFQLDPRDSNYVPPKEKFKAFSGTGGRTLGSTKSEEKKEEKKEEKVEEKKIEKIEFDVKVDESKPTTMIQVKMPDGTSLKVKLNLDHQVSDLKKFISCSDPKLKTFSIMTTFPRKEISNESETIEKAGLKNSTVMVNAK